MTYYFHMYGTDNFYNNVIDPVDVLRHYRSDLEDNAAAQIANIGNESRVCFVMSDEVVVGAHGMDSRLADADEWIKQNQPDDYTASSVNVVLDYWNHVIDAPMGVAYKGTFNSNYNTCLINLRDRTSQTQAEHAVGHEVGHVAGGLHEHVAYRKDESKYDYDCRDPTPEVTYMYTAADKPSTCNCRTDYNSKDASGYLKIFSSECAQPDISDVVN